jgi:peptidase A4-like protein
VRVSVPIAFVTVVASALCAASVAAASGTSDSANWAGYAIQRQGVAFHSVSATWRQPSASCTPGEQSFSSMWVGLGGFNVASTALEQIGTEVDCSKSGETPSSAWYELVPAPTSPIRLTVKPGDLITAKVLVSGHQVTVSLHDATSHHSFSKTVHALTVDVSSAEWIVEAPSQCFTVNACQTLPLADFGTAAFSSAKAQSSAGHGGSISDRHWTWTRISLKPDGHQFVGPAAGVAATASSLRHGGTAFTVTFERSAGAQAARAARLAARSGGYLLHPGF